MKIGLSGFVYGNGTSGISTYVAQLVDNILKVEGDFECNLHLTHSQEKDFTQSNKKLNKWPTANFIGNPLVNIAWHSSVFPVIAKAKSYDLVHIPSIRRLPLVKSTKLIVTVHDLSSMFVENKYDLFRDFYHKQILSRLIHNADHIIAVSHNTKKDIVEHLHYPESKISVIYSGIDHTLFKPRVIEKKPHIVYVSRIEHPGKNHIRLIEAFEKFKLKNNSPHKLLFAGADWNGAKIVKEFAKESKVKNDIHFLGFITNEELVDLYSSSALTVFPSLYEGFGFPVIEAYACKAPVICSNNSSLKEIAKDHSLLFDPFNVDEIAQAIEAGLTSSYREKNVERAKKYALTYNWGKCAKEVLNVYKKVCQ